MASNEPQWMIIFRKNDNGFACGCQHTQVTCGGKVTDKGQQNNKILFGFFSINNCTKCAYQEIVIEAIYDNLNGKETRTLPVAELLTGFFV